MATRREPPEAGDEEGEVEEAVLEPDADDSVRKLVLSLIVESTNLVRQEI